MNVMAEYENMFVVQEQLSITMLNKIMNKWQINNNFFVNTCTLSTYHINSLMTCIYMVYPQKKSNIQVVIYVLPNYECLAWINTKTLT